MAFKVLVADSIAKEGIDYLKGSVHVDLETGLSESQLVERIGDYDSLIVRSETKVTEPVLNAGSRLKVVARAGIGVDNIDVETATRQGILVVNAPLGNTIAAAEHTMALMLAVARNVAQANSSVQAGEWKRSKFMGTELQGKTLGIIGLGKVGREVARRAWSFGMNLIGTDPYVSPAAAESFGVRWVQTNEIWSQADVITLHAPLIESNRNLVGETALANMKPGAFVINVARGGLIDEQALAAAVRDGRIAGAGLDVFSEEPMSADNPLRGLDKIVLTPHLGASTREAQVKVALEVAEQVVDVLNDRPARGAVNAPALPPDVLMEIGPYLELADKLGRLFTQLHGQSLDNLEVVYSGEITARDTRPLRGALLRGILEPISTDRVSIVNAELIAHERGIQLSESKDTAREGYTSTILLRSAGSALEGTVLGEEARVIGFNGYPVDFVPEGNFLFCPHVDTPGVIGAIGTVLGANNVNISAAMSGRLAPRGETMLVLTLDEPVPDAVCRQIWNNVKGLQGLIRARV